MTADTTHDLILCNRLSTIIPSVNNGAISPYNGLILKFESDNRKTYKVRKNVQGRFLEGKNPSGPTMGYPAGYNIRYSVTSLKFNNVEFLLAPANYTYGTSLLEWTSFPFYTLGNEFDYTNNVANAVYVGTSATSTGNGSNNFYQFIESIVNSFSIPVKVAKTPYGWWVSDGYLPLNNISFEKYYDDNFEITFVETTIDNSDNSETSDTKRYVFDGTTVEYYLNGVLSVSDLPQESDAFSFFSYPYTYGTLVEIPACPVFEPFNASLSTDNCSNISISADCKKITFSDTSNYDTNGLPGHDPELFNTRIIKMTRPDGTTYIWATENVEVKNETIQPYLNSSNAFQYLFTNTDKDGIYSIQLCSYPDWTEGVVYDAYLQPIVWRNGKLYKAIATNSNADPSIASNATYWSEYTCISNCDDTRYCVTEKVVVLCISLLRCYKQLVADAFCSISNNPCKNLCDNKQFQNAMKFRITLDSLEFSTCAGDWNAAQKEIDILNSICCCS